MIPLSQMKVRAGGAAALVGVGVLVAACGSSGSANPATTAGSSRSAAGTGTTATAAARRTAIDTTSGSMGTYLIGTGGRAVYLWVADTHGRSRCTGACAQAWPPVTTRSMPMAGGKVTSAQLGTIRRPDGSKQVTYDHHPLYYYVGDPGSGTTSGEGSDGFGARWWLVAPAGTPITSGNASSTSPSSKTTGRTSSTYSY